MKQNYSLIKINKSGEKFMAVASLVLGIVAIVFSIIPGLFFIGIIAGVIGIVLGVLAKKQLTAANQPTGMATGGMVTSIIGAALGLIIWLACMACSSAALKGINDAAKEIKKNPEAMKQLDDSMKQLETELNKMKTQ